MSCFSDTHFATLMANQLLPADPTITLVCARDLILGDTILCYLLSPDVTFDAD